MSIEDYAKLVQSLRQTLQQLQETVAALRADLAKRDGENADLRRMLFGKRREPMSPIEREIAKKLADPEARTRKARQRRAAAAQRKRELHEVEVIHPVDPEREKCPGCDGPFRDLGAGEASFEIEHVPARFVRRRHVRQKRVCRCGTTILVGETPSRGGRRVSGPACVGNLCLGARPSSTQRRPTLQDFIPKTRYRACYNAATLRGDQDALPWDLQAEMLRHVDQGSVLLDVGCGAARKVVGIAPHVAQVFAVDPSDDMRREAAQTFASHGLTNATVLDGRWGQLPIADASIDVVTSMLAGFLVDDVVRVLRPGGIFVLETIGAQDQVALKTNFGTDDEGPRGQYLQFEEADFLAFLKDTLGPYFKNVQIINGFWDTYYTQESVELLLTATPIVRNFDRLRDEDAFLSTVQQHMTSRGIKAQQNRVLVTCTAKL